MSTCVGHMDPIVSGMSNSPDHDNSSKHSNKSTNVGRIQLQRMISKCSCMVYYISYDRADPIVLPQHLIPPLVKLFSLIKPFLLSLTIFFQPLEEDEISHSSEGATTLTLLHSNLNVVTNSVCFGFFYPSILPCYPQLQYHMIVDIINDLILYVEPRRKVKKDNSFPFEILIISSISKRPEMIETKSNFRYCRKNS